VLAQAFPQVNAGRRRQRRGLFLWSTYIGARTIICAVLMIAALIVATLSEQRKAPTETGA